MPIKETDVSVYEYKTSKLGVNMNKDIVELDEEECIQSQNLIWANGMVKRGGQFLASDDEVVASKKISGLHRFYKADGTKQLLAACDTKVKYLSGGAWVDTGITLTTGNPVYMTTWGPLNTVYICNGVNNMWKWNGTTATEMGTTPADQLALDIVAYGKPRQALAYQDRLLTILGGVLVWSASYDDDETNWEAAFDCGIRPDTVLYGMGYHAVSNEQAGYDTKILLAGASGMYLLAATSLIVPYTATGSDYALFPLAVPVGCNAPKTICWTPKGTMWLGADRQVYLLPWDEISPVIVGTKIRSNMSGLSGIESIPPGQIKNACAAYHNGHYILSVTASGGSNNTIQWWANIDRGAEDGDGVYGPWYGPMVGQSISCFANQNGSNDAGELVGGEATEKGYVYYLDDKSVNSDINSTDGTVKAIHCAWQTYYNPLGNTYMRKDVHKGELELLDVLGTVSVGFSDISGMVATTVNVEISGASVYWNDSYWGEDYWSSSVPARAAINISPAIHARRVSLLIENNTSNDTFELYAARLAAIDQGQMFE